MEAQYKSRNGRLMVKVEAEKQKDLFKALAEVQEVFDTEQTCGLCKSPDIRFNVRTVDGNDFYELVCRCGAKFEFGQHKVGSTLFPKRRSPEGNVLPNGGWSKWDGRESRNAD